MENHDEPLQRIHHEYEGEPFWMDVKMSALESDTFKKIADSNESEQITSIYADAIAFT